MSELRPQISKTRVGFTQNRIHLALVYLHLTHQMQFCKSHSIAKRHFCLSCPSEGSGGWGGGALLLPGPGPGGRAPWWRLSLAPPMSLSFGSHPRDMGRCWSLLQDLTHSGFWSATETWAGSTQNTESLCQIVSVHRKHKAAEAGSGRRVQLLITANSGSSSRRGQTAHY